MKLRKSYNKSQQYRYHLPTKAIKANCPQCGQKGLKTLSRYIDSHTGELLPAEYGRCDREDKCGYFLSPYDKGSSGMSYADGIYGQARNHYTSSTSLVSDRYLTRIPVATTAIKLLNEQTGQPLIYTIPDEVFRKTIGHYDRNNLATLLHKHFGQSKADGLLKRFLIGTSSACWPGAAVFWYIDEHHRVRGGQVVLFGQDGHTVKKFNEKGVHQRCTSWAHTTLTKVYEKRKEPLPTWLIEYNNKAPRSPIPFGLHQLSTSSKNQPIALVESPKTAIVCSGYYPEFIWLAIGSKSYLKGWRLDALRNRKIVLFPDLNAYDDIVTKEGKTIKGWFSTANELRDSGFQVNVSDLLEKNATAEQRQQGLDLADYLLEQHEQAQPKIVRSLMDWVANPGSILRLDSSQLEYL